MKFRFAALALAFYTGVDAFQHPSLTVKPCPSSSTALFVKSRKAKKMQNVEKQSRGRSQAFYDAIKDAQDEPVKKKKKGKKQQETTGGPQPVPEDADEARRVAQMADAQARMEARPPVSTMIVDDETGIEIVAQGQSVLDVVTRKAVKLSDLGPEYRLAQMFPGIPPDVREKHRMETNTAVPQMVERLKQACSVKLEDGSQGIPPFPSVANSGIDFVLANRDLLGEKMKTTLGRMTMNLASEGKDAEAAEMKKLWKHFMLLENHISAPFRQIIQDAEGRVGPNFGNLELTKYAGSDLYERIGDYIVLKGMVAHWEKKVVDANKFENIQQTKENFVSTVAIGNPKRYLPDPPVLFSLKECTQVCAMAQKMCQLYVDTEELYADFPPEIVFLEEAFKVKGGTALRKFMVDDFCPARGITPEALREGMKRFYVQLENMQIDPYGDMTRKVGDLYKAMAVGTDDEKDAYFTFTASRKPGDPGFFQTYTFDYPKSSLVRFFDNQYPSSGNVELFKLQQEEAASKNEDEKEGGFDLGSLFNLGAPKEKRLRSEPKFEDDGQYQVPDERRMDRPRNLGWFEKLNEKEGKRVRLGEVPPGTIIPDD